MRSRKALINTLTGISYELVALLCGFIVPRLILGAFGSDYNGVTSSITQFLACVTLFKTSIAGVTRAALYRPLSEHDTDRISSIIKATEQFIRRIALIFAGAVLVFACLYPFLVRENFGWFFSFSLVLILAVSTFVQYYFGITYQILLEADQKHNIIYLAQIASTLINTLIAAALIRAGCSVHVVKLGSALAFSLNPLIIRVYVRRHYTIVKTAEPDTKAIRQRWDAFGQAAAAFVHNNTDMVVLTVFSTVYEISVYTVYYMVCNGIKTLLKTFTSSIGAAFGNMLAKGEDEAVQKNMDIFEYVGIMLSTVFFTIAGIMMLPFVGVYTKGVTDVAYLRPWFSLLMVVGMAFFCYRIPYQSVIEAAGHYRQTRNGAILEAVVNIVISVATVIRFGLIGVAIGTLIANLIRTVNYVGYCSRRLLHRSVWKFVGHMLTAALIAAATAGCSALTGIACADTYLDFALHTVLCGILCAAFALLVSLVFYRRQLSAFLRMLKRSVLLRGKRPAGDDASADDAAR